MNSRVLSLLVIIALAISLGACGKEATPVRQTEQKTAEIQADYSLPKTTSAGTPINYSFDLGNVDMEDTPDSSCFSEIGYDEQNEVLVVVFRDSGSMYAYYDVPEGVWDDLYFASSMGSYYNKNIKGQYDCEKIE